MRNLVLSFSELTPEQPLAGGKGGSLARLYQAGYPVPDGFVILPAAFVNDELQSEAWTQVQAHLARLREVRPDAAFAVRSSALSEDSAQASFAGEFETVLNVRADEDVRQAIHTVRRSRHGERVRAYGRFMLRTKRLGSSFGTADLETQDPPNFEMAVVVQRLVKADAPEGAAGVLFTAHPVTGRRDQALLTATWGLGEAIVGGTVTPDTLTVDKATGRVLARDTADKQVMTVRVATGTEEQPVPADKRRAPVLSDAQAAELVGLGARIEELYGMPMDVEWVLADGGDAQHRFAIVQARPITALPTPEPTPPTDWKLPKGTYMAMRNNIVELMAEPLTPLFGTLGLAAVNASMGRLLAGFFGRTDLMPENLIITVNEYAYYNGSIRPLPIVRILLGSVGIARRMFTGAVERWTEMGRPLYVETVARWQAEPWRETSSTDLLDAARALAEAAIDAYGALVGGVIPAAWISEALFTIAYDRLIKRRDDLAAPTYLLGFDSAPIQAEKALYDLAGWARTDEGLAAYLIDTPTPDLAAQLGDSPTPPNVEADTWHEWQDRFQAYLQHHGHTIYDLDFANPVPADDPAPVLETLKLFVSGQGANPHERQQASAERREAATQAMLTKLAGWRLKLFRKLVAPAQRYAPLREDGLSDVGLAYPLLRQMLRELGRRLVAGGMIQEPDDVFWLVQDEVAEAAARLDRGEPLDDLSAPVPERQAINRAARRATPPRSLPQFKFFGIDMAEAKARRARECAGDTLKGVAASPGRVTAPACVLHGPEDFGQMRTGDVLVAGITTPAWTPLFVRASAVVTDVGGPLSHGSIVAREYGIPAVLGTGSATKRIRNGQVITVDGSAGVVTLSSS
ncbi:MAG: phosphoenolpyruvate synthase [Chloroflexi bacterium]|nr:phosphoenolpyruvate synthase [Chloroflexota bacterium]MBU1749553.1 phosphoenolpyruvate synthase [Chloroflexota bacterium]